MKTGNWLEKLLLNKNFYVIGTAIFFVLVTAIFSWQRIWRIFDVDYVADNQILGTYGDFIGGVLGTLFALISTLFLVKTFSQQRSVTERSIEQVENQRFNDLFFELLRLYQSEVAEFCTTSETDDGEEELITNKDFFDFNKTEIQKAFQTSGSFAKNMSEATKYYMIFYIENRTKLAACYRTLYRIYDLLDKSSLNNRIKSEYLKILRAQLTESELFFMRYNALTYQGNNFITYINKYNILKHLPAFELLEFKDWWKDLDNAERMGMNIIFHDSRDKIAKLLCRGENEFQYKFLGDKYRFKIQILSKSEIQVCLTINHEKTNHSMEIKGLEKYTDVKIQALLDCYLKEVFVFSNFGEYNRLQDIQVDSAPIQVTKKKSIISSVIKNKLNEPLILRPLN